MHVALASPDYLAADRVALETMGIPPRGEKPDSVRRVFKLHDMVQHELSWLQDL